MAIKTDIVEIYSAGLAAVNGEQVVKNILPDILDDQLSTADVEKLRIIAVGKAADAMLQGALSILGVVNSSLLISKSGHISISSLQNPTITCIESAHPVPDESSLLAGKKLLEFLQQSEAPCLVLISGGASSLVEVLVDNWCLLELRELTEWMLANAYCIDEMNAIRSRLSQIKAGKLWSFIKPINQRKIICLMISDVPTDDVSVIGSGLLFSPKQTLPIPDSLPDQWREKIPGATTIEIPSSFYWKIVATNRTARQAAAKRARQLGYAVKVIDTLLEGDAEQVAKQCVQAINKDPGTLFIWGAETTVVLPDNPGRGGRNQHLALAAAIEMRNQEGCYLLSAGTDGTDGFTEDAGALIDGYTVARAEVEGFDAEQSLRNADSGSCLEASGDLLSTGVTGTNVMDLIIAYGARKPLHEVR